MKARQPPSVFLPGLERYALKYLKIFFRISLTISTTIMRCQLSFWGRAITKGSLLEDLCFKYLPLWHKRHSF